MYNNNNNSNSNYSYLILVLSELSDYNNYIVLGIDIIIIPFQCNHSCRKNIFVAELFNDFDCNVDVHKMDLQTLLRRGFKATHTKRKTKSLWLHLKQRKLFQIEANFNIHYYHSQIDGLFSYLGLICSALVLSLWRHFNAIASCTRAERDGDTLSGKERDTDRERMKEEIEYIQNGIKAEISNCMPSMGCFSIKPQKDEEENYIIELFENKCLASLCFNALFG